MSQAADLHLAAECERVSGADATLGALYDRLCRLNGMKADILAEEVAIREQLVADLAEERGQHGESSRAAAIRYLIDAIERAHV